MFRLQRATHAVDEFSGQFDVVTCKTEYVHCITSSQHSCKSYSQSTMSMGIKSLMLTPTERKSANPCDSQSCWPRARRTTVSSITFWSSATIRSESSETPVPFEVATSLLSSTHTSHTVPPPPLLSMTPSFLAASQTHHPKSSAVSKCKGSQLNLTAPSSLPSSRFQSTPV